MSEWACVECGHEDITSVQPSVDEGGTYMTGLCPRCSPRKDDASGNDIRTHRVGVTRPPMPVQPRPKRAPRRMTGKGLL